MKRFCKWCAEPFVEANRFEAIAVAAMAVVLLAALAPVEWFEAFFDLIEGGLK